MIVVLGSRFDPDAVELASAWRHAGATLCDADDATSRGWRFEPHAPKRATAVAGGRIVHAREIDAVVTCRYAVDPNELACIVPDDRPFVASEITAFLHAFFAALRVPVANRPAGFALCGPVLRPEQWRRVAHEAGVPCTATDRSVPGTVAATGFDASRARRVFVAGERASGDADERLHRHARAIARSCGATVLEATFTGGRDARFVNATAQPSLRDPRRRDAVLAALLDRIAA